MVTGIVDEMRVVVTPFGVDHHRAFLGQHLREADDGVERRAQLVAHGREEAALGLVGPLGLGARVLERCFLFLALGDVAHHRHDLALAGRRRSTAWSTARQRISIQTNCEGAGPGSARRTRNSTERLSSVRRAIGERSEIGRTIRNMHALEQAMAEQLAAPWRRTAARPPATRTAPCRSWRDA